jgi:cysteine sulfinate desulfinase/cysteine desulfurase-like protein
MSYTTIEYLREIMREIVQAKNLEVCHALARVARKHLERAKSEMKKLPAKKKLNVVSFSGGGEHGD